MTCLCFAGYAPFRAKRMMKWSQMGKEQNSFLRKKGKGVTEKKNYECQPKSQESAPFHTIVSSILQKKKKETAERKVTLQWPWNYWFHRKRLLEKQAQLLSVLTSLVPDHCFQGCGWIHPVVFIFVWHFTSACKKQKNIKTTLHRARQFLECENINIAKLLERLFISCLFSVFN